MQVALVTVVVAACVLHVVWTVLLPAGWRQRSRLALRRRFGLGPGKSAGGNCESCGGGCDAASAGRAPAREQPVRWLPRRRS